MTRSLQERFKNPSEPKRRGGYSFNGLSLFSTRNVGSLHLTNIGTSGILANDQLGLIGNWYARTNIASDNPAVRRAWDAWTHITTVTMVMGCWPMMQLPLAGLLQRHEGQRGGAMRRTEETYAIHEAAQRLFHAANQELSLDRSRQTFERELDGAQECWYRVAREAAFLFDAPSAIVCPVRQSLYVRIETETRALAALIECMPTDIAPQALVWVHLEGIAVRCCVDRIVSTDDKT